MTHADDIERLSELEALREAGGRLVSHAEALARALEAVDDPLAYDRYRDVAADARALRETWETFEATLVDIIPGVDGVVTPLDALMT